MISVDTLLSKCRSVCSYANKSVGFAQALIDAQLKDDETGQKTPKYLVQDVVTRWNSAFLMLERFAELKEAVIDVLDDFTWKEKVNVRFYSADWDLMNKLVTVLKIFKEATEMLSSSEASISQIIPIVVLINESLKTSNADHGVKNLKTKLQTALLLRFKYKENDRKYSRATLLDPRYKKSFFLSKEAKEVAVNGLLNELKETVKDETGADRLANSSQQFTENQVSDVEESFSLKSIMKRVVKENEEDSNSDFVTGKEEEVLYSYLSAPIEEVRCLDYWKDYESNANGDQIRLSLVKLAKKYLTPPPTSTDVERLFSVAGLILTNKRATLLPENVDKLLFVKENLRNLNFEL